MAGGHAEKAKREVSRHISRSKGGGERNILFI
jgi:hypothetical protein